MVISENDGSGSVVIREGSGSRSRWILIDCYGEEIELDVEKFAIIERLQVHARDLRILDPLLSYPSAILTRDKAIILNLQDIKAIVTAEEVLFRYPSKDHEAIHVVEEFRRKLILLVRDGNGESKHILHHNDGNDDHEEEDLPFEFRVLEMALQVISSSLDDSTETLETAIYHSLDMLSEKIDCTNLARVRILHNKMTRLVADVQKIRDELKHLLDNNGNMSRLYLSKKLTSDKSSPMSNDSTNISKRCLASPTAKTSIAAICGDDQNVIGELETFLEAYHSQIEGLLSRLTTLREYVGCTQDFISIQLENHRNQLLQLELFLSTTALCLTLLSLVAGLFGVSIPYKWNHNHGYMFKWVVISACTFSGLLFVLIISHARRRGLIGS